MRGRALIGGQIHYAPKFGSPINLALTRILAYSGFNLIAKAIIRVTRIHF